MGSPDLQRQTRMGAMNRVVSGRSGLSQPARTGSLDGILARWDSAPLPDALLECLCSFPTVYDNRLMESPQSQDGCAWTMNLGLRVRDRLVPP